MIDAYNQSTGVQGMYGAWSLPSANGWFEWFRAQLLCKMTDFHAGLVTLSLPACCRYYKFIINMITLSNPFTKF